MDQGQARFWIEVIAAVTIPIGIVAIVVHRIVLGMGFGVRSIQFLALVVVLPMVLVLALEGILAGSAVGALFGALVGYLFANIGKFDERKAGSSQRDRDG